jgi:oligopeptidase B
VLLDGNLEAGDGEYFALGALEITRDGTRLAWSADRTGDERFTLRVRDAGTSHDRPDEIPGASYGAAWSADGSVLFYLTTDDAGRPDRAWRHAVGTPADRDALVFHEPDERFWVGLQLTRSQDYIVIESRSEQTAESRLIPAAAPEQAPAVVAPRREGTDYSVDHDPAGDRLLILHNDGAEDFALAWTPAARPGAWQPLIAGEPGTRLLGVAAFAAGVVVSLRRQGRAVLWVLARGEPAPREIPFPDTVATVGLDQNLEYDPVAVRIRYMSLLTPETIYDYDLTSGELTRRRQTPDRGGYRPQDYAEHREWARSGDGTQVPVTIVCRRDTPRDGSAPAVLYGYGAYEACAEPRFSAARLSLLDRGFVYAIAHVRGGGELGRRWYTSGRLSAKPNSFADFAACARHLARAGWTSPGALVARGASAGGLLAGVLANQAPETVTAIVADMPFVDPLSTLLDPGQPLTVTEWEEWGNPLDSAADYACIKSYSPQENVAAHSYPAILALASGHDTRVALREPLRWIARLRAVAPAGDYVLRTELDGGHGGASGRYDLWREEAFILAWIITQAAGPA